MKEVIVKDLIVLYSINILSGFIQIVGGLLGLSLSLVASGINNLSRVFSNMIGAYHMFNNNKEFKLKELYLNSLTVGFAIIMGSLYIFHQIGQGQFSKPDSRLIYILIVLIILISYIEKTISKRFKKYKDKFFFPNREKTKFDQMITLMVLFSLVISQFYKFDYFEGLTAFIIGILTTLLGITLLKEALSGLLGKPFKDRKIIDTIDSLLQEEKAIKKVENLVITKYGNHYKVIMTILLEENLGYEQVYDFLEQLEKKLKKEVKYINVYVEPK